MEGLFIYYAQKNIRQMNYNYYCILLYSEHRNHTEWLCGITPAAYQIASTPYHECTQSHQLRTMTLHGHINSLPWMNAVTSTPYHEWKWSHQLRTMNENGHTNSVPWMKMVTLTPYHEWMQFVESVKSLSFSLTTGFFGPIVYIHGTELMRFGNVTFTEYKNQHKVTV
jgi:hypothetical protein